MRLSQSPSRISQVRSECRVSGLDLDLDVDVDLDGLVTGKLFRNGMKPIVPYVFRSTSKSTPRSTSKLRTAVPVSLTMFVQARVERRDPLGSVKLIARNETPMA